MKKDNRVLTVKIGYITISVLTVLLGVFLIIRPEISLNVFCRILGAAMVIIYLVFMAGREPGRAED